MKKRHTLILALITAFPVLSHSETVFERQRKLQNEMVKGQHTTDIQRKEDLLKKMRGFMKDINGRLGTDSNTNLDIPIDMDKATDVTDIEHFHTNKKVQKPVYGYVNADSLKLRASAETTSQVVDRLGFGEKLEIITKTEETDTIDGITAPWVMVRRSNSNEGWAFGGYIQKDPPKKNETVEEKKKAAGDVSGMIIPTTGRLSSKYGYRVNPITKKQNSFHKGIDIAAPKGTPVYAASDGIVRRSEFNRNGYGNLIVVEHEKNISTYYGHLSARTAGIGQRVKKGQLIGKVGATGLATGPHLHFEVRKGQNSLNPEEFLP